jgi:osmotically inducible protein OsmC
MCVSDLAQNHGREIGAVEQAKHRNNRRQHGQDPTAFHRDRNIRGRAQRAYREQRPHRFGRSVGAEGHGRSGKPGAATPEHLFAAGYAACFGGALDFVGKQHKQDAAKAKITCAVSIGPREGGGFGIAVKLRVEDKSLKQADLAALTQEAHERICPYSHATRGNVAVQLEIIGG